MIVSHKYKFIFIKTKKTAGTSIEIALSEFLGDDDIITPIAEEDEAIRRSLGFRGPQNTLVPIRRYTAREYLNVVRTGTLPRFSNHMPASLIRRYIGEPIWNEYFVFCFERNPYDKAVSQYFWRTRKMEKPPDLNEYLRDPRQAVRSDWFRYTIDDTIAADFVGRYERLADDLEVVRQRVGLPEPLRLPRAKSGYRKDRRHYGELLDREARRLIEDACSKELEAFGYHFDQGQRA